MDSLYNCTVCSFDYDCNSHKPCIGTCGHSICHECVSTGRFVVCPVCRANGAFQTIVINFGLLSIVDENLNNSQQSSTQNRKRGKNKKCSACQKLTDYLVICVDCCLKEEILVKTDSGGEDGLLWNLKRTLVVCEQQARAMATCSDCALTGLHKGHNIREFEFIKKTLAAKQNAHVESSLKSFHNSFDWLKEKLSRELEEYRNNGAVYLEKISQSADAQPDEQSMDCFLRKSAQLSKDMKESLKSLMDSIGSIEISVRDSKKTLTEVAQNQLFITDNIVFNQIYVYSFDITSKTLTFLNSTKESQYYSQFVYQDKVYIIGGGKNKNYNNSVVEYDCKTGNKKELQGMNHTRGYPEAAMNDGKIFVCGGREKIKSVEEYDFEQNKWTIIGNWECPRANHCVISFNKEIYVVQGWYVCEDKSWKYSNKIEKFDRSKSTFVTVTEHPDCLHFTHGIAFDGKIFLAGNRISSSTKVMSYNPLTNVWKQEASFVKNKDFLKFYCFNDSLYVYCKSTVEKLNNESNQWELVYSK